MNILIFNYKKKVRKYTKSGLPRKTKKSKLLENANAAMNTPDALAKKKSLMYSSADDDKSMNATGANMDDQSNQLDTTASSLNNTMTGQVPGVVKKRKYTKRKNLDPNSAAAGVTGLSKVEGTKLIIQKKAIKLAMNSGEQNESFYGDHAGEKPDGSVKPKKPRMSKKFLKSQLMSEGEEASANTSVTETGDNNLKLKISLNNS